jgi:uncharacterized protein
MAQSSSMVVGMLHAKLLVRHSRTLTDKRQVVRSIVDRLKNSFNISVGEVDTLDDARVITLGVSAVGHEHATIQSVLQSISEALRAHPVAEFLSSEFDVQRFEGRD